MRRFPLGFALATVAAVSPLSAQTWQTIGTANNTNTGAYWNNASDDNIGSAVCNVGAILTNTPALAPGSCSNQAPVFIPLNPAPLTTSNLFLGGAGGSNPGGFGFNCTVACNVNLMGRVAGNTNTSWGTVSSTGVVTTAAQFASGSTVSGTFAVWITQALPMAGAGTIYTSGQSTFAGGVFTSNANQQFSAFSATPGTLSAGFFGTIINVGTGRYFVGMEDNVNGGRGFGAGGAGRISDRDYNDILVSIQAVPEPATIGLMGFGLLALAGIAKRRKA